MSNKKYTYKELQDTFYAGVNCPIVGATFEEYLQCHNLGIINYDFSIFKKYEDNYDFNLQLFGGEYVLYIDKQNVNLFSTNGCNMEEIIKKGFDYLERINKKKT